MAETPTRARWSVLGIAAGSALAFVAMLTLGNAPTVFFGYGLSAFAVLVLAYALPRNEAFTALLVGTLLGAALLIRTQSLFTFVAVGAVVVRTFQLALLVWLKPKHGFLGPALLVIVVGAVLAIAVGIVTYGGEGTQTAFAVLDAVYIVPAYFLLQVRAKVSSPLGRAGGQVLVVAGTVGLFLSASAFFLIVPFGISIVLLFEAFFVLRAAANPKDFLRKPGSVAVLTVVMVLLLVAAFAVAGFTTGEATRAAFYPLYPDSLAASQWLQTSSAAECRQGNVAGGGTVTNGVWGYVRLRVLETCVRVTGTVEALEPTYGPAVDGDYGIDLRPDANATWTLALGNYVLESGLLHIEVVPSDLTAVLGGVPLLPGEHLMVTGAWVLDTDHGWGAEIHPAWSVVVLPS